MKKIISIAIAALMILSTIALTACGGGGGSKDYSDSKYVGTWKASTVALADESGELEGEYFMTLNADGTGELTGAEGEDPTTFTWEPTSGGFKTKGDMKLKFTDDGDNVKVTLLGVDLIFEKQ